MIRNQRILPLLAAFLLIGSLSLAGCRRDDSTTPTPEPAKTVQVVLPMVGDDRSPLPAPGTDVSPLPTPGTDQSPLQP